MLLYRDQPGQPFPPDGYLFYQPETNWWSSRGLGFWQTVDEIVAMRKLNSRFADLPYWSTDRNVVADQLSVFTCVRLRNDPRFCDSKKNSAQQSPPAPTRPRTRPDAAGAAGDRVRNFAAGVGVVIDWLGSSLEPVPITLASRRAAVCVACPQNGEPDFIQRLEGYAAESVRQLIKLKHDLDLSTPLDDRLHHCQVCDCFLKLKVHARLDHVLAHTSQQVMNEFPGHCWIKTQDK